MKLKTISVSVLLFLIIFCHNTIGSMNRASDAHAIIAPSESCLLGGVRGGMWIKADDVGPTLKGSRRLKHFTLSGPATEIIANRIRNNDTPCTDTWFADIAPEAKEGIAIESPAWNVMPRIPRAINPKDATYVRIISDILKSKGITQPDVQITESYKIDLEGDGQEEVVIAANRYKDGMFGSKVTAGDYSLLLLRKIVGGRVQNVFLSEEYYPKSKTEAPPNDNHITAFADLNGDGVMEIIARGGYYEGSGATVFEVKGSKATMVLDCFCGV